MKHILPLKQLFLFLAAFLLFSACQEDKLSESKSADNDMIEATKMADDYLNADESRRGSLVSITVLRYKGGKLYFATNQDNFKGYAEVNEETVTAMLAPNEYVFWYAGEGITDIVGIEFDPASQSKLSSAPEGAVFNRLWFVQMPDHFDSTSDELKYDIIYQYRGNTGEPIRLDPKLKIEEGQ